MLARLSIAINLGEISGSNSDDMIDHLRTLSWLEHPVTRPTELSNFSKHVRRATITQNSQQCSKQQSQATGGQGLPYEIQTSLQKIASAGA
jgi:hypothetical protein